MEQERKRRAGSEDEKMKQRKDSLSEESVRKRKVI